MSNERRVDPQVQVGLLVDPAGFPLEVHLFEGINAEPTTFISAPEALQERHGVRATVAVAGACSRHEPESLEDAGFTFIVGSRLTKAPTTSPSHFVCREDYLESGKILESRRVMGTGKNPRERWIVYQYSFKRQTGQSQYNPMFDKAACIGDGNAPLKKARFPKVTGAGKVLDQASTDRVRQATGFKCCPEVGKRKAPSPLMPRLRMANPRSLLKAADRPCRTSAAAPVPVVERD